MSSTLILPSAARARRRRSPRDGVQKLGWLVGLSRVGNADTQQLITPGRVLAVAGLAVWFLLFRPTVLGGPASYIIVSGSSMEPTLRNGDLAIMQQRSEYRVGDVVVFPVQGSNVIHRIVGESEHGFVLQGDNKEEVDFWKPGPNEILGRLWLKIPSGGRALASLRQPHVLGAIAAGIGAFYVLGEEPRVKGKKRRAPSLVAVPVGTPLGDGAVQELSVPAAHSSGLTISGNGASTARTERRHPVILIPDLSARISTYQLLKLARIDGRMTMPRPLSPGTAANLVLRGAKSEIQIVRGSMPRDEVVHGI